MCNNNHFKRNVIHQNTCSLFLSPSSLFLLLTPDQSISSKFVLRQLHIHCYDYYLFFFFNYYYLDYYLDVFIPCWAMRSIYYPHSFALLSRHSSAISAHLHGYNDKKNTHIYINIYDARHRLPGIRESIWAIPHPGHLGHAYGSAHGLLCVICTSEQGFSSIVSSHPRGHTTTPKDSGKFCTLREKAKWRA